MVLSTGSYSYRRIHEASNGSGYTMLYTGHRRRYIWRIKGIAETTVDLGDRCKWTVFRVPLLHGKELNGKGSEDGVNAGINW